MPTRGSSAAAGLDLYSIEAALAGVIDADYRGEIACLIYNTGSEPIELPEHSKICQLIIEKIVTPRAIWTDELADTKRGAGGFGSTG